ncbi:MAG: hypothetical protein GY820_45075 [Gammaproteobacteria bacterium]|nr:hypothetical protein [Gammaproteobacteria bacterium]
MEDVPHIPRKLRWTDKDFDLRALCFNRINTLRMIRGPLSTGWMKWLPLEKVISFTRE